MIIKHALTILLAFWILPSSVAFAETGPLFRVQEKGKWGFINRAGKIVIKPQFDDSFYQFSEGLAAVKIGGKWGYIDETGQLTIPAKFDGAQQFKDGIAAVEGDLAGKGKWGYIDKTGSNLFEPDESFSYTGFKEGLMPLKKDGKWGYINTRGEWAIPSRFADAEDFSEGLAGVRMDDGTAGYIDTTGKWVIRLNGALPHYYGFSEGLAPVFVPNERIFGFINRSGEFAIPPRFDAADSFNEGRAAVCIVGKDETGWPLRRWGAIDRLGNLIVPAEYETVWSFQEGMAKVVNEEGNGFVNLAGELAIPCKFDCVDPFQDGLAYVRIGGADAKLGWSGYIDKHGKLVWRPRDFATKDKARAAALLAEKKRKPTIKLLTDSKSDEMGLLVTCLANRSSPVLGAMGYRPSGAEMLPLSARKDGPRQTRRSPGSP